MKRCVGLLLFLSTGSLAWAQDQPVDNLQQQYRSYQSNTLQEKLFVHTDKTFYLAGETVWFKIYSVDASFHKPFAASSIAYIEILNKDLKPVIQSKISMLNGIGNGSVTVPGFLATGHYIFRAYTSWMRNFPADFYYEQILDVVNTLKPSVAHTFTKSFPLIQFFPEGGNEVVGFPVKIAFKATDAEGHGLDCQGVIVNQKNDTLTRFQSFHRGMGTFQLTPEKNGSYYALVRLNDSLIKQKLPDAETSGIAMNVRDDESGKIKITVYATAALNNTNIYLFTHSRQIIKNVQTGVVKEGEVNFIVDRKDLAPGISAMTVFNHLRQPVCERLIFKRPEETLLIQAKTDQQTYDNRKPVKINLNTSNSINSPLSGNLSLSVFMIDSLQQVPDQNILYYLYLGSDIRGRVESPEYYFLQTDKSSDVAMDNLLLTQGWRRFKWNDVSDYRKPSFEFLPEWEGPVVNGRIINKLTGKVVPNSVAFLSIPGADYAFSSATSDADGQIRFGFKDIYKNNALVVQAAGPKDTNYRVDISSAYSDKFSSTLLHSLLLTKTQENALLSRSIGNQVENTYNINKKHQYTTTNPDTTSFYGKPDRQYNLEEYTHFQTMEEVMREFVEDVRVRKEGQRFIFKVRNRLFGTYFEEDPLILLDGIPISNASRIIALDPLKVKRIEVVMHNYYVGSSVFEGIVNVKSYSGEIGATQIDPNALVIEYEGLQQQREFYSPEYSAESEQQTHMPDFRNVLFWAPQIKTGTDGKSQLKFYTSDLKGKFAVVVQGLSSEGLPGKTVTFFDVAGSK